MNNLLIATFEDERAARSAMRKLDGLAYDGEIDLYQRVLVRKLADGRMEVVKGDVSAEWQTLAGAGLGSLIGLFGGPVGFVIGMIAGAAVGSGVGDLSQYRFGKTFVKQIKTGFPNETVSIIANMGERGSAFVDSILIPFGAEVSRSKTSSEKVAEAEIKDLDAEIGGRLHAKI
jgi:uncharacterized membrane protein